MLLSQLQILKVVFQQAMTLYTSCTPVTAVVAFKLW